MDRTATGLAAAALLVGGAGLLLATGARDRADSAAAEASGALSALAAAEVHVEEARRAADAALEGRRAAEERLAALEAGLALLASGRGAAGAAPAAPGVPGAAAPSAEGAAARKPAADPAQVAEFKRLRDQFFRNELDGEDQQRFWEYAKREGFLDSVIAEMEAAVAGSPEDIPGRMELSRNYIARLFTVPPGPEMGVWASKAEVQWKEVLARDDRHWEARNSLASSWARYPDFLNKGPDAIREFETLRRQQEAGPVEARQSQVYLELSGLYKRAGNPEKQRAALEDGIRRHPEDEGLRKALEVLNPR